MPKNRPYRSGRHVDECRKRDNEAYRQIRLYRQKNDEEGVSACFEQLSSNHARRCAKRLLNQPALADALDELLAVEGIRSAFLLKTMHKVIALRCREEILSYFAWIKHCFFETITQGDRDALLSLDESTVRALEQKCPRYDAEDRKEIESLLTTGKIFATKSADWRQELLSRLCDMQLLIPSLFTFHNDIKVLEYCAHCMRHLIDVPKNGSITTELRASFTRDATEFEGARLNLWLYARKRHLEMPLAPRRDDMELLAKIRPEAAKREDLAEFADYAAKLGFWTPSIQHWATGQASHAVQHSSTDCLQESAERPLHRCGFPDIASFRSDRAHLSLERLNQAGLEMNTFHVLRSVLYAFFTYRGATSDDTEGALSVRETRAISLSPHQRGEPRQVGKERQEGSQARSFMQGQMVEFHQFTEDGAWEAHPIGCFLVEDEAKRRVAAGYTLMACDISSGQLRVEFTAPRLCLESALRSGIGIILVKPVTSSGITDDIISYCESLYKQRQP